MSRDVKASAQPAFETDATSRGRSGRLASMAVGVLRAMRPTQWIKNVLVLAAPLAASSVLHAEVMRGLAQIFLAFCCAASAVYLLNDTMDAEADRAHPTKRRRPIAAGIVPSRVALSCSVVLALAALALAALCNLQSVGLVAFYLAVNVAYSVRLKQVALLDVMIVATGFVVRAAAGGVAVGTPLSQWFLLTATFGSLFIAVGKRASDVVLVGAGAAATRKVLDDYPPEFLRFLLVFSAAASAVSYGLWAFSILGPRNHGAPWPFLSMVTFVFLLLRYAMLVELGKGGEPEQVILRDRMAQIGALAFAATFVVAVAM